MYCEFLSFSGLLNMIFLVGTSSIWNLLLAHTYVECFFDRSNFVLRKPNRSTSIDAKQILSFLVQSAIANLGSLSSQEVSHRILNCGNIVEFIGERQLI